MTQKRAKSLEQIEKELEALKKQKRNALKKKNQEEIETLGKIAKKAELTPKELEDLIDIYTLMKQKNLSCIDIINVVIPLEKRESDEEIDPLFLDSEVILLDED